MAQINVASITAKLKKWETSKNGAKALSDKVSEYVISNKSTTSAGYKVITMRDMENMSKLLIRTMKANASLLPDSVAAHFSSLVSTAPKKMKDGRYQIEISFADDLSRPSLEPGKYGGVDNIVAIFNNGYPRNSGRVKAIENVSGFWHGEYIHAKGSRPALNFMQASVDEFNAKYGALYDVIVTLNPVYEG